MATPSASSSVVTFVKKYPITLCGFSLLFMPSVHRLLLYFTPLLLSTAVFIVAMLTWGPSAMPDSERDKLRRGKRNEWAFNGSLKIYEEEEEEQREREEEGEEIAEFFQKKTSGSLQQEDHSMKGKASRKLEAKLQEPDRDFDEENDHVGTASNAAISWSQAEQEPVLGGDGVGPGSNGAISGAQAEPQPDLGAGSLGTGFKYGATSCIQAEPDPDLHGERVGSSAARGDSVGTVSHKARPFSEQDRDSHAEQHIEAAHNHDSSAEKDQLHAARDHHHHLHDHAEPAPMNPDEQAADEHLDFHDAEPDHVNYLDAEVNHIDDHDDSEPNHLDDFHDAEPDPDLHAEDAVLAAAHAQAEGAHVQNDDLHAVIAELRQKLGMMKGTPYSDDTRDRMHSQQLAERFQTLQAAA